MGLTDYSIGLDGKKIVVTKQPGYYGIIRRKPFPYIPPGKKVHVTISTYKVVYRLHYTFEFSLPKFHSFPISYRTSCCCGLCCFSCSKNIPYPRALRHLPNFREDDEFAYFTQEGFLTWIGESCEIDKQEAPVYAT